MNDITKYITFRIKLSEIPIDEDKLFMFRILINQSNIDKLGFKIIGNSFDSYIYFKIYEIIKPYLQSVNSQFNAIKDVYERHLSININKVDKVPNDIKIITT